MSIIKKLNKREALKQSFVGLRDFIKGNEEDHWHGVQCGDQMLDFNIYDGDVFGAEGTVSCQVMLCEWRDDNWYMVGTGEHLWTLSKSKIGASS